MHVCVVAKGQNSGVRICTAAEGVRGRSKDQAGVGENRAGDTEHCLAFPRRLPDLSVLRPEPASPRQGLDVTRAFPNSISETQPLNAEP